MNLLTDPKSGGMPLLLFSLLLSLLLTPAAGCALEQPAPYTAEYTVHANGFKIGELQRSLQPGEDDTWVLESTLYTTGLVALFKRDKLTERSVWRNREKLLQPIDYLYHYSGRSRERLERVEFNWEKREITSTRDGESKRLPLRKGVLDKLMFEVALRRDLATGAKHIEYRVADRGEIRTYVFDVVGEEQLVTSIGKLDTIKVTKGETTFWCAPALDYLMVQIVKQEDDYALASYITALKQ